MFGQVSNGSKIHLRHSRRSVAYNERYDVVRIFSIISEIIETTIQEKRDDAKDESVEAIFQSILRQKNLDIRDKKAAIVDFIAAGIHTVCTRNNYSNSTISLLSSLIDLSLVTNYFTSLFLHFSQLGNTLVFLFDLIGRNPAVQNKLYEETYALAPAGCDLTIDNLRKAKYLRACITESLR